MRARRILAFAAVGLVFGLLMAGWRSSIAPAQCDPAGGPCEPPKGEREKPATPTDTRLALSVFSPTATRTAEQLCLEYADFLKCIGNPGCQPVPPLCPSKTPTPSSTPTPTVTPSPKPTV